MPMGYPYSKVRFKKKLAIPLMEKSLLFPKNGAIDASQSLLISGTGNNWLIQFARISPTSYYHNPGGNRASENRTSEGH